MKVIEANFEQWQRPILAVRREVFIQEQNVPKALEIDGLDSQAWHVLVEIEGTYVATGRILRDGHVGRIAVVKKYRGRGIGINVVQALLNIAKKNKIKRVYLGSQLHARGFYEQLGFKAYGVVYQEAGIDHILMDKFIV